MFKLEKRDQQLLYSHFQVNKYFSWYFIVLWSSMKYSTKVEGAFASTSIWTSFHVCKHTSKEKKACVTDNSRKKQKNRKEMEKQNRKRKKNFSEVYTHPHPAVVQFLRFHNYGPAFLPLDASIHMTQNEGLGDHNHVDSVFGLATLFTLNVSFLISLCYSLHSSPKVKSALWNYPKRAHTS